MYQNWPRVDDEYLNFLNYIEDLNLDSQAENGYNNILKLMVSSFKAESGQICLHNSHNSGVHRAGTFAVNLSWHFIDQYISYYHNLDPFVTIMPEVGAFRNQDLMPSAVWRDSEFNADFIKPQKVKHLMVTRLLNSNKLVGHIGIFRPASAPGFTQKDLYKAQLISSLLSRKIQQQQVAHKSGELDLLLKQLNGVPSTGVIVLDMFLNPVYSNLKMMDFEMPAALGSTTQYGNYGRGYASQLPDQVLSECRNLVKTLLESEGTRLENRHIVLWQLERKKVDVEILTLPIERSASDPNNSFYLLLIFSKNDRSETSSLNKTITNLNLTPKEAEIGQYICQGLTNKQISQRLYVSLPTVATHVQHIFHKAGISRRSQLVSQMLS
jgi:DNA-binding CsgD family transcriptional regulator